MSEIFTPDTPTVSVIKSTKTHWLREQLIRIMLSKDPLTYFHVPSKTFSVTNGKSDHLYHLFSESP